MRMTTHSSVNTGLGPAFADLRDLCYRCIYVSIQGPEHNVEASDSNRCELPLTSRRG